MAVIIKYDNGTLTDTYLELIGKALSDLGEPVSYVDSYRKVFACPKNELVVCSLSLEAFHLVLRGYRHILFWFQGVAPEENFLVRGSRLKLAVFNMIEWIVVRRTDFFIFVSETLKRHVVRKYKLGPVEDRSYCMPCMNTELHPEAFSAEGKYSGLTFTYTGSMMVWQSFEKTAELYAKIEKAFDYRSEFLVLTQEQEKAEQILKEKGVRNYFFDYVPKEELPARLAKVKYGFIIREDNTVNRVATPTKISTYLSCGVIPIYSECLEDFAAAARNMTYAVCDGTDVIKKLKAMEARGIDPDDVLREYRQLFDDHYSLEKHLEKLRAKLKPVYEKEWKDR